MISARILAGARIVATLEIEIPIAGVRELRAMFPQAIVIVPRPRSDFWTIVLPELDDPGVTKISKQECPICHTGSILSAGSVESPSPKAGSSHERS